MSLVTAGTDCTVSQHLWDVVVNCSIAWDRQLQKLCQQRCCTLVWCCESNDASDKLGVWRDTAVCCWWMNAVRDIQSSMLRQISSIVEDEASEMPEPDVVSQSPQQSQLTYALFSMTFLFLTHQPGWFGHVMVRASDLWSSSRGFRCWLGHHEAT